MSVINQVLQDLEQRNAHDRELRGARTADVRATTVDRPGKIRPALQSGVMLLVVAGAAGWFWFNGLPGNDAPATVPPQPVVATRTSVVESDSSPTVESPSVAMAEAVVAAPVASPDAGRPAASAAVRDARAAATASPATVPVEAPVVPIPKALRVATPAIVAPTVPPQIAAPAQSAEPVGELSIDRRDHALLPAEKAEVRFRQGVAELQRGRAHDAEAGFQAALAEEPRHQASRQALLGLLLGQGRMVEAERLMHEGLAADPGQASWALVAARLQADRGDAAGGVATLERHFDGGRQNADYLALLAGLRQRLGLHPQALQAYSDAIALG
ncbi:MAG: hypothetical protein KIT73_05935, partial [Burkholderiales bacterium]|nr:hypothetical protein [Burkholderiales bacterium]